jgi:hypothetical protein
MTRFKRYFVAAVACLMLAAALAMFGTLDARAQPGPPTLLVRVVNPASEPVPVRNIDDFAAKNAFSTTISVTMPEGSQGCPSARLSAPTGRRFVIEHVSARASLPQGQHLELISLVVNVANPAGVPAGQVNQFKELVPHETASGRFVASQDLRAYADEISISCLRSDSAGDAMARLIVSGYLADVP